MRNSTVLAALVLALTAALAVGQENYAQWTGSRTYLMNTTATGANVPTNVLGFPVLIRLGAADSAVFAAARGAGQDVRFTKDGTLRLPHQIERWDSAGRDAEIWVRLDTVRGNALTQTLRMHWGKADAADSSNGAAVFPASGGFQAVFHMIGDGTSSSNSPDEVDATANALVADNRSTVDVQNPAIIGRGRDFNGSNEHFRILGDPSGPALDLPASAGNRYTVSAWASSNSTTTSNRTIVAKHDRYMALQINSSSRWEFFEYNNRRGALGGNPASPWGWQAAAATAPVGAGWHHIVGVSDSAAKLLYVDGVLAATNPGTDTANFAGANATAAVTTDTMTIGRRAETGDRYWQGDLDEVRLASVARSAAWIKLEYESQKADQAFIAPLQAPTVAYAPDSVTWYEDYATPVAPLVPRLEGVPAPTLAISPALPAGMSFNTTTGVISGAPTQNVTNSFVITATSSQGVARDTVRVFIHNNENLGSWTGTRALSIDGAAAGLSGPVARFPMLVRLGPADSAVFAAGRNGLRFTNGGGVPLHHEVEQWDSTGRKAAVWVLMDTVRSSGPTPLNVRYGNATAASRSDGAAVFDGGSGFIAAWHMGTATGAAPRANAVAGGNPAVPAASVGNLASGFVPITGIVGMADTLRGQHTGTGESSKDSDDHFNLGTGGYADFDGAASVSLWAQHRVPQGDWSQFVTMSNGQSSDNIWIGKRGGSTNLTAELFNGNASSAHIDAANVQTPGEWALVTFTANGPAHTLYRNGVQVATRQANGGVTPRVIERTQNHIGRSPWPDFNYGGGVDEVRIANVARSADWVRLEYASQRPGAAPLSGLSYPKVSGAPGAPIAPVSPTLASGSALKWSVTPALPAGLSMDTLTGVISGTPTATGGGTFTVKAIAGAWSAAVGVDVSVAVNDGAYTTWAGHKYVIANTQPQGGGAGVAGTVSNFPVLVRLGPADAAIFAASQKNGADIRFTANNNTTRLKHEIDWWDSTSRTAAIWVKVDSLRGHVNNNAFRIHWGKAGVADSSGGVFETAQGHAGVWHMGGPDGSTPRENSVPGGNPALPAGSAANLGSGWGERLGVIGLADSLRSASNSTSGTNRANDDHLNLGTGQYANFTTGLTISMWAKPIDADGYTGWTQYISFSNGQANNNIWMGRQGGTTDLSAEIYDGTTSWGHIHASGAQSYGAWQHLAYTVTPTGSQRLYHNGNMVAEQAGAGAIPNIERGQNHIGRSPWGDRNYRGGLDEVRLARTARSADWIKLEYQNQRPGAAMVFLSDTIPAFTPVGLGALAQVTTPNLGVRAAGRGLLFRIQSPEAAGARLAVLDVRGSVIWSRTLKAPAGSTEIVWDGTTRRGGSLGSGVYVVRMALLDEAGRPTHAVQRRLPLTR